MLGHASVQRLFGLTTLFSFVSVLVFCPLSEGVARSEMNRNGMFGKKKKFLTSINYNKRAVSIT